MKIQINHGVFNSSVVVNGWAVFRFWGLDHKRKSKNSIDECFIRASVQHSKEVNKGAVKF